MLIILDKTTVIAGPAGCTLPYFIPLETDWILSRPHPDLYNRNKLANLSSEESA